MGQLPVMLVTTGAGSMIVPGLLLLIIMALPAMLLAVLAARLGGQATE